MKLRFFVTLLLIPLILTSVLAQNRVSAAERRMLSKDLVRDQLANPDDFITPRAEELYQIYGASESRGDVNPDGLEMGGPVVEIDHQQIELLMRSGGQQEDFVVFSISPITRSTAIGIAFSTSGVHFSLKVTISFASIANIITS